MTIYTLYIRRILFALCSLICLGPLTAQTTYTVETVPDPKEQGRGYVSDPDDYLPEGDEARLNNLIAGLEDSATAQLAVVVLESIGQENPKDFATRLFSHWGIGQADIDNGLLLLSVMDQRRTEFETGYGLEGVLPDAVCYRVGMQELVPHFREGNYGAGLIAAVQRFKEILEQPEAVEEIRSRPETEVPRTGWYAIPWLLRWYVIINLVFHAGVLIWIFHALYSKEDLYDKYMDLYKVYSFIWLIFFPIPYALVYLFLNRKLKQLRNYPRYSKVNGQPMRKLSEPEDDAYLEKGQVTEEEIDTADYDVWVSEDGEEILVLRYGKRYTRYEKCPECGFVAYYHAHTKTVKHPTYDEHGKKEKLYLCKNCGYSVKKYVAIPKKGKDKTGSWGGGAAIGGASSWGSAGSSWSGGSSGGSSWGGGSSGGGGAGVSW